MSFDKFRMRKKPPGQPNHKDNPHANQLRLSTLTTTELKVFMLMREGFTNKECAERLNMKQSEIKDTAKSIFRKLGVKSLAELIVKYREHS